MLSPTDHSQPNHADHLWETSEAGPLDPVARLVYRSNLLGQDQRITNTGGGNTSAKLEEVDPLTGQIVDVLWVKGSGGDLRTSQRENFASLYMSKVDGLKALYAAAEVTGPKSAIEDEMVGTYPHCTFRLNPRAASIDTPLHAFVPHAHVDHTHPTAVIAVAASRNSEALTAKIWGGDLVWTSWQRPGFDLGLRLADVCREHPDAIGAILGQHGLINWADDDRTCYDRSIDLIERAGRYIDAHDRDADTFGGRVAGSISSSDRERVLIDLVPWLRGKVSGEQRFFATVEHSERIMEFVDSADAERLAELGTSCPDHFLRTKIKPLFVAWDPASLDSASLDIDELKSRVEAALVGYRGDYTTYYEQHKRSDSPAMRDPNPTVCLIPGLGMIAFGKSKSESRVTAEFYKCAVEVMRGAEAIDEYIALPKQEAFDIEYWLLEEAKLQRMPAEKEFARRVVLVVGAGNGIGRRVCERLAADGAHVVCADVDCDAADSVAAELTARHGKGIGVAGSGISDCGPVIATRLDVTDRSTVRAAFERTVLAYGGVDDVVITAGIYVPPSLEGRLDDDAWGRTYDVNVRGVHTVASEARRLWHAQGLTGTLTVATSVNAVVSKSGSLAYDTSKAAANHLVRELAIELAPLVRVNAVAPATVVEGSTMFPRERVLASLAKYSIPFSGDESTTDLRQRLARFYAERTLTGRAIRPSDVAEAIAFLVSDRSSRSTGQIIAVDGGLSEAFLR